MISCTRHICMHGGNDSLDLKDAPFSRLTLMMHVREGLVSLIRRFATEIMSPGRLIRAFAGGENNEHN